MQLLPLKESRRSALRLIKTFTPSRERHFLLRALAVAEPSPRKLVGIALILLLILVWATFVASLAQVIGRWPVLVQAAYYLFMGVVWIIPLKPLVRWIETGSFRTRS